MERNSKGVCAKERPYEDMRVSPKLSLEEKPALLTCHVPSDWETVFLLFSLSEEVWGLITQINEGIFNLTWKIKVKDKITSCYYYSHLRAAAGPEGEHWAQVGKIWAWGMVLFIYWMAHPLPLWTLVTLSEILRYKRVLLRGRIILTKKFMTWSFLKLKKKTNCDFPLHSHKTSPGKCFFSSEFLSDLGPK